MGRWLSGLGLAAILSVTTASAVGQVSPETALWLNAIGGGLAAFSERVQGGSSKQQQDGSSRPKW
jgi:hypothetical protein